MTDVDSHVTATPPTNILQCCVKNRGVFYRANEKGAIDTGMIAATEQKVMRTH